MSALLPIDQRHARLAATPARVHPSWTATPTPPRTKLDAAALRRLWDAVDAE